MSRTPDRSEGRRGPAGFVGLQESEQGMRLRILSKAESQDGRALLPLGL